MVARLCLVGLAVVLTPVDAFAASSAGAASRHEPSGARTLVRRHMDWNLVRLAGDGAAAFVGGTMGVAGTLAVYENNRFHAKQRAVCAYCESPSPPPSPVPRSCPAFPVLAPPPGAAPGSSVTDPRPAPSGEGTGNLKCANCMGTGIVAGQPCPVCHGAEKHVCVNCEGTGLSIPASFERKEIKALDDEDERLLDEIGIAALADDIIRAENQPGDMLEVGRMLQRRALSKIDASER